MVEKSSTGGNVSAEEELVEYKGAMPVKSEAEALKSIAERMFDGKSLCYDPYKRIGIAPGKYMGRLEKNFWSENGHVIYLVLGF